MTQVVHLPDEFFLEGWAADFANHLAQRSLVIMSGPMGVGKTTFVKKLLKVLGGDKPASPTFALHNVYQYPAPAPSAGTLEADHLDLFRLEPAGASMVQVFEATGLCDLFQKPQGLILVEWGDKMPQDFWPEGWHKFYLEFLFAPQGRYLRFK